MAVLVPNLFLTSWIQVSRIPSLDNRRRRLEPGALVLITEMAEELLENLRVKRASVRKD